MDSGKTTFMSFFTSEDAKRYAESLTAEAIESIEGIDCNETLVALALHLCDRKK